MGVYEHEPCDVGDEDEGEETKKKQSRRAIHTTLWVSGVVIAVWHHTSTVSRGSGPETAGTGPKHTACPTRADAGL
jgi:hypothetical protein